MKQSKSVRYQYLFTEVGVPHDLLDTHESFQDHSEHYKILNQIGIELFVKIICQSDCLTPKELKVMQGFANGGTQRSVANSIGTTQSAMPKFIDYFRNGPSMNKLILALSNSDELWHIARQLRDCEEE